MTISDYDRALLCAVGSQVRAARERAGISVHKLASVASVKESSIESVERGECLRASTYHRVTPTHAMLEIDPATADESATTAEEQGEGERADSGQASDDGT